MSGLFTVVILLLFYKTVEGLNPVQCSLTDDSEKLFRRQFSGAKGLNVSFTGSSIRVLLVENVVLVQQYLGYGISTNGPNFFTFGLLFSQIYNTPLEFTNSSDANCTTINGLSYFWLKKISDAGRSLFVCVEDATESLYCCRAGENEDPSYPQCDHVELSRVSYITIAILIVDSFIVIGVLHVVSPSPDPEDDPFYDKHVTSQLLTPQLATIGKTLGRRITKILFKIFTVLFLLLLSWIYCFIYVPKKFAQEGVGQTFFAIIVIAGVLLRFWQPKSFYIHLNKFPKEHLFKKHKQITRACFVLIPYFVLAAVYFGDVSPFFSRGIIKYVEAEAIVGIALFYPAAYLGWYQTYIFMPDNLLTWSKQQFTPIIIGWFILSLCVHTIWYISFSILSLSAGRVVSAFVFNWVEVVVLYNDVLPSVMLVTTFIVMINDFYDKLQQPYLFAKIWLLHYDRPALTKLELEAHNAKVKAAQLAQNTIPSNALIISIKPNGSSVCVPPPPERKYEFMEWRIFYKICKRTAIKKLQTNALMRFSAEFSFIILLFLVLSIMQQYTVGKIGNYSTLISALLPFIPTIFGRIVIQGQFWNSSAYLHHVAKQQMNDARSVEEAANGCTYVLLRSHTEPPSAQTPRIGHGNSGIANGKMVSDNDDDKMGYGTDGNDKQELTSVLDSLGEPLMKKGN